jgi:hypothetical protein
LWQITLCMSYFTENPPRITARHVHIFLYLKKNVLWSEYCMWITVLSHRRGNG